MKPTIVSSLLALACAGVATAHGGDLLNQGCRPIAKRSLDLQRRQLTQSGGEGQTVTAGGGASAARYSCDPNTCKLPKCHCADTNPPGGLDPKDVPQFIVFTADDAVQDYTINSVNQFLAQRKNPNGCTPVMSYYVSLNYTNYAQVTELYVNGNDVADHTMTHQEQPATNAEIDGNLITLNALAGIPYKSIIGYRAPFLNYSRANLEHLANTGFTYDSSSTASVPVTDPNTDAFWPYTLDNGMANDCSSVADICGGQPKLPGFWEIPMYAIFDQRGAAGAHLMDPWLDSSNASDVLSWMKNTFTDHYNGKRQPFGVYTHPIHLAKGYPGLTDPVDQINMLNEFLDWATTSADMQNVWIISNKQLMAWMQNPVPASQLNTLDAFKCQKPNAGHICNGFQENNDLLEHCISNTAGDALNNSPFYTCYGCPVTTPSPQQPNPPQKNNDKSVRTRIPANCDTAFWDPINARCTCNGSGCAFDDSTRPIGPNGSNLTSSGSSNTGSSSGSSPSASSDPYRTFGSGAGRTTSSSVFGWAASVVAAAVGGAMMVFI
ncbi:candidate polysaccharide deacetylase [Pseudozyma hubeiensis SY62]|uniref:Candidate polysaccharide deacetylase n=1 Tax=Pseudozyma hubeiensis (strain SY62) TaxID=1305764 RepID=R9PB77_PSEHS|nr:candidate polysaccharide deacetylase [Pseudozyma hubeiensis SY62]GAC98663.1 candidate polysaccharide deacetylase [Pseudozyma hubeiensis SY62]